MIEAIYVASHSKAKQRKMLSVEVVEGKGIIGDRSFGKCNWPGQNITFIEIEEIEKFNIDYCQSTAQGATRRNIITSGIRLNKLVHKEFMVGDIKFFGTSLCEPCTYLGDLLKNNTISKSEIVKAFVHKGGLHANILSSGKLSVGCQFDFDHQQ